MKDDLYYTSAADAARAAGVSDDQIIERVKDGRIEGGYQAEDGRYRVPVKGLLRAGYQVTGEGADFIGPLSIGSSPRRIPQPDEEDETALFWHGEDTPSVRFNKEDKTFALMGSLPLIDTPQKAKQVAMTFRAAAEWVQIKRLG